jgi:hypothetical protein
MDSDTWIVSNICDITSRLELAPRGSNSISGMMIVVSKMRWQLYLVKFLLIRRQLSDDAKSKTFHTQCTWGMRFKIIQQRKSS